MVRNGTLFKFCLQSLLCGQKIFEFVPFSELSSVLERQCLIYDAASLKSSLSMVSLDSSMAILVPFSKL